MTKESLRIVFMGTPDFAVASLRELVENNYNVVGVITMPDKPAGRGHKLQFSAVKEYALSQNLNILQPEKLKDEIFLSELNALKADLQIVVAFRMLPQIVWDMPTMGTFNLHGSLLPQYRGAAPINWAIINGEKETGVTTFFLKQEIDTGEIILQEKITIGEKDNFGKIYNELMIIGAKLVVKTVDLILQNKVKSIPQNHFLQETKLLKDAPKIFKETCKIDWHKTVTDVYNLIRGLSPYPVAWTEYQTNDKDIVTLKIHESQIIHTQHNYPSGTLITDNKKYIHIACTDGFIEVLNIQLSGKKKMSVKEVLNGYKFENNSILQ